MSRLAGLQIVAMISLTIGGVRSVPHDGQFIWHHKLDEGKDEGQQNKVWRSFRDLQTL